MERDAFALMAAAEQNHWWFRGRREFISAALARVALPANAHLLDAGCGSGGNLPLLSTFGTVSAFEFDDHARSAATALNIGSVEYGALPDAIPFGSTAFDAIGLFDVLEHLDQPAESLVALRKRLHPTGALVITVPALPGLWGPHDVQHQHKRRYTRTSLIAHLREASLSIEYLSYFNSLLLPLAIVQRLKERAFGYHVDALTPPSRLNTVLLNIWRIERLWIPRFRAPIGLSLLAIARPASHT